MKKIIVFLVLACMYGQAKAQWYWSRSQQDRTVSTLASTGLGLAGMIISEADRARQQKLFAQEKERMNPEFNEKQADANEAYAASNWSEALVKYSDAARLNDRFGWSYGDQGVLVSRIAECTKKSGKVTEGNSVHNNDKVTLADYSQYTRDVQNPVYNCSKKDVFTSITRVSANSKETRIEMEFTNPYQGAVKLQVKGKTYIKGKKSGKLELRKVENISIAPNGTEIEFGKQTLRFALIFGPLSESDEKFDFTEPGTKWKYKDIKIF